MTLDKQRVLSWAMSVLLVAGTGAAFAQEVVAPEETVDDGSAAEESTTTTVADGDSTDTDDTTPVETTTPATTTPGDGDAVDDDGDDATKAHPDHGKLVSEAAHDHSHDAACGNHGRYVSGVAKTGQAPACASGEAPPPDAAVGGNADDPDDTDAAGQRGNAKPKKK